MTENYQKYYIVVSIVYVALGLVLLILPETSLRIVAYALAGILIFWGFPRLFRYCTAKTVDFGRMDLVIGLSAVLLGAFIIFAPEFLMNAMPLALGVYMLLDALMKLQNAIDLYRLRKNPWTWALGMAGALLAMGLLLIWDPFSKEEPWRVRLIGICLVVQGVINLFVNIWMGKAAKEAEKGYGLPEVKKNGID